MRTLQLATYWALAIGLVASMLLAQGANAQASACDRLKVSLAGRIDPSIRGFTLEAVPADAPVPPGAKVIGTCEGGARKILLHRSGSTRSLASQPVATLAPVTPSRPGSQTDETVAAVPKPLSEANDLTHVAERVTAPPPIPAQPDLASADSASFAQRASEFLSRHWHWIAALTLVIVLGAALWAWLARRSPYDASGLPRGPKLN